MGEFSQMGEQNLGPNRRFSPKWENTSTKPCAGLALGVHLPVIKVCSMDSSAQITLIHRLLQNFTVYCLSN